MLRILMLASVVLALSCGAVRADVITFDAVQTGGFYPTHADNDPAFQNYFVGYGTSPGGSRTDERRSFFWFDLSAYSGTVISAELTLTLPFGGLIFGKGPGDPTAGPVPSDPMETFQLSSTPAPAALVTSLGLPAPTIGTLFGSFAGAPTAAPVDFVFGGSPPPVITIPLNSTGIALLNSAPGGDVVLTGWMPSWSHDTRLSPTPPPLYFEASELIFGLTDVHTGAVPMPTLTVVFTPVPEPSSVVLAAIGMAGLARRLFRRSPALGTAQG